MQIIETVRDYLVSIFAQVWAVIAGHPFLFLGLLAAIVALAIFTERLDAENAKVGFIIEQDADEARAEQEDK